MDIFSVIPSILVLAVGFGALIFFHELGHFLAAKWARIRTEAFAIGMGPVVASWRKGIGFMLGSTRKRYEQRLREHVYGRGHTPPKQRDGEFEITGARRDRAEAELGLGETEYSLRWFPIGGFVKMLGQEDANPKAFSDDPRSYNMCPIGKRMVVVSAGVVANVIVAFIFFIIAFLVGVQFDAPVIGYVASGMPAATTTASNARELGIDRIGLQPGDRVLRIDDRAVRTFADLQIASAMARRGETLTLTVERSGYESPLRFELEPVVDETSGLLSVGVGPGKSARLLGGADAEQVREHLDEVGLGQAGVEPGMELRSANGVPVSTIGQLDEIVDRSGGKPLATVWVALDENGDPIGKPVRAPLPVQPVYQQLPQRSAAGEPPIVNEGLFGLTPLLQITDVPDNSPNRKKLAAGDVFVRVGPVAYPRWNQLHNVTSAHAGRKLEIVVLRDGERVKVDAAIDRKGRVGVHVGSYLDQSLTAEPVSRVAASADAKMEMMPAPAAPLNLPAGSRIADVDGAAVASWPELRAALRKATAEALEDDSGATVRMEIILPTPQHERETVDMRLDARQVRELHDLGWRTELSPAVFAPIHTTLSAGGDPIKAITMGFAETHKMILMTYLTIDRLFRGTVGVEQLRGPVGIVELGAKILPRGFMYFLFFLGMISVNLAVLNFLPLPIVDGGLFLFLIYEKIKGRPPSVQFQNAATLVGLCLIGTLFLVTFYNDIARLLG